jgi:hypothetical protein
MTHYHGERNHQGLGNALIREQSAEGAIDTGVHRRQRLGGILNNFHRAAA